MKKEPKPSANPMWGGHFAQGPAAVMSKINACITVDRRLYAEDIEASKAHASMLGACAILSAKDTKAILKGLDQVKTEIDSGKLVLTDDLEDVHMNVEARLAQLIGDTAGRLHTARSRNDQVAVDFRLWTRRALDRVKSELSHLQTALLNQAERNADTLMPGFTHLQTAQPVTFGHHLMAYFEMFARDQSRLMDARARMNECPLGAAALAGTSFPIDRDHTAKALGFDRPMANSMDAVSDRDFAIEYLSVVSLIAVHLSRLAEEMVLWTSQGMGFVHLSEAFTTGSSIMPQKRNPDAAELIRGKTGTIIGCLTNLLITMKGLPLAYNKDMQETKQPVIDAADQIELMIAAMAGMVADMSSVPDKMSEALNRGFITATDLADWLVKETGLPFRAAHHVTGRIVRLAEEKGCRLDQLSLADMQAIEAKITQSIFAVLAPTSAAASRKSYGGTSPQQVKAQAKKARKRVG